VVLVVVVAVEEGLALAKDRCDEMGKEDCKADILTRQCTLVQLGT
jgi:hypothetical protein